jgi:hypothetical protein
LRANGSRECAADDRLREAIHPTAERQNWIASVASLPAMTKMKALRCLLYLFERDEAIPLIGAG